MKIVYQLLVSVLAGYLPILFSFFFTFILPELARAKLFYVQLQDQKHIYVIPGSSQETAEQAFDEYIKFVERDEGLRSEIPKDLRVKMRIRRTVDETQLLDKPKLLAIGNRSHDSTETRKEGTQRRIDFLSQGLSGQSRVVVLPMAATGRFSDNERKNIHLELIAASDGAIALGGADVDPGIYGATNTNARNINKSRDGYELLLLRDWIQDGTKALFGFCRGHQLIAAALGFKLIQHIENHGDGEWVEHEIDIKETVRNRLLKLLGSFIAKVNSYHHQSVSPIIPSNLVGEIEIAATARDGTVESLESKDGRIWTFQFHPEFMFDGVSKRIFRLINSILLERKRYSNPPKVSCRALL